MKILTEEDFKFSARKSKKKQFLLCDTLRPCTPYIQSLRYRIDGTNPNLPHFVIDKKGETYKVFPTTHYSAIAPNKAAIVICMENLGWLHKNPLGPFYQNWIGDAFRGEPYCARWKDYFFWDPYTDDQLIALANLIDILSVQHHIPKELFKETETPFNAQKFNGIVHRHQYSTIYRDITPAFNGMLFEKLLNNESQKECK